MSKDKFADLLNGDLDGTLTEREREALERLAANDESLRYLRTELHGVSRLCSEMEEVDPPPGLRSAVRRAIQERTAPAAHSFEKTPQSSWFGDILARLIPVRREIRLAYVVLGGIALAGVILALVMSRVQQGTLNQEEVLGTMMLSHSAESAWKSIPFTSPAVQGRIATQRSTTLDGVLIDLHYLGTGKGQLHIDLGTREIRTMSPPADARAIVQVRPGQVILEGYRMGELRLVLNRPETGAGPVRIVLRDGEVPVMKLNLFDDAPASPGQ